MKIRSGIIHDFGLFHEAVLPELSDLVLFLGDNEAGKSTLLAFLRQLFFGFARPRDADYLPSLSGTHRAGQLELLTAAGEPFTLGREDGEKTARFRDADGRDVGESALQRLLRGATAEAFHQLFAFSLDELQSMDGIRSDELTTALYGLTLGTSVKALPRARTALSKRLDELFKNRGQKPLINDLARQFEDVHRRLAEAKREMDRFEETVEARQILAKEITAGHGRRNELSTLLARSKRIQSAWETWQEWLVLESFGEPVPDGETPVCLPHKDQMDGLLTRLESLAAERQDADDAIRRFEDQIRQIRPEEPLLNQRVAVIELRNGLQSYQEKHRRRVALEVEAAELAQQAERVRARLGREWPGERLAQIDLGLFTRQRIRDFEVQLNRLRTEQAAAANLLEHNETSVRELEEEIRSLRQQLDQFPATDPPPDPEIRQWLQRERPKITDTVEELPRVEERYRHAEQEFRQLLRNIQPAWTEEDLRNFDTSTAARRRVVSLKQELEQARQSCLQGESKLGATAAEIREKETAVHRLGEELQRYDSLPDENSLQSRQSTLRRLRRQLYEARQSRERCLHLDQRAADLQHMHAASPAGGIRRSRRFLTRLAVILLVAAPAVASVLLGLGLPMAGGLMGGGLLVVSLLLFTGRRFLPTVDPSSMEMEERHAALQTELAAAQAHLAAMESDIGALVEDLDLPDAEPDPAQLDELEEELETARAQSVDRRRLQAEMKREESRRQELQTVMAEGEAALARYQACEEQATARWDDWTRHNHLPAEITPEMALEIISRAETVRLKMNDWQRLQAQLQELQRRMDQFRGKAATAGLGELAALAPSIDLVPAMNEVLQRFDDQLDLLEKRSVLENERKRTEQKLTEWQTRREEMQRRSDAVGADLKKLQADWRNWLAGQGLDSDLDPVTATEALERILEYRQAVDTRSNLIQQDQRIRQELKAFEDKAVAVFSTLGQPDVDSDRLPAEIEVLLQRLAKAEQEREDRDRLDKQKELETTRHRRLDQSHAALNQQLQELLSTLGCGSVEEFRRRLAEEATARESARRREMLLQKLKALSGLEQESEIRELFGNTDPDRLATGILDLQQEERELQELLERQREEKVRLGEIIRRLSDAGTVAELRSEEEAILAELNEQARQWAVIRVADTLIDQARQEFERKHQPAVIQQASALFGEITGGRYPAVKIPIGESRQQIHVISRTGAWKEPHQLSRGTREQLYLAIRFGYIANHGRHNEPLPVIMDDILVNFDPPRAQATAAAIARLSIHNQVLFFTCHPHILELFGDLSPPARIIRIVDGTFQPPSTG